MRRKENRNYWIAKSFRIKVIVINSRKGNLQISNCRDWLISSENNFLKSVCWSRSGFGYTCSSGYSRSQWFRRRGKWCESQSQEETGPHLDHFEIKKKFLQINRWYHKSDKSLSLFMRINKLYINNFAQKSTKFLRRKVEVFNISENSGKLSNLQRAITMGSWHAGIDPDTVLDKSWDEDINRHWDCEFRHVNTETLAIK